MAKIYTDYHEALANAIELATRTGLDTVIRHGKEYNKAVFKVNLKSNDGSDWKAETVTPNTPHSTSTWYYARQMK